MDRPCRFIVRATHSCSRRVTDATLLLLLLAGWFDLITKPSVVPFVVVLRRRMTRQLIVAWPLR